MESLKSLKAKVAEVERRVRALQQERTRLDHRRGTITAEILGLTAGYEPASKERREPPARIRDAMGHFVPAKRSARAKAFAKSRPRRARPDQRPPLAAWILQQRLPMALAALATRARAAGYSGRPNAVAATVTHSAKLRRLTDGRVGHA